MVYKQVEERSLVSLLNMRITLTEVAELDL